MKCARHRSMTAMVSHAFMVVPAWMGTKSMRAVARQVGREICARRISKIALPAERVPGTATAWTESDRTIARACLGGVALSAALRQIGV